MSGMRDDGGGIGERLARLRRRRGLTQEELAERAAVSVELVRKLEQGRRRSVRLGTLHGLARALDVQTAVLFDAPSPMDPAHPGPGVVGIRRALTPGAPVSLEDEPTADGLRLSLRDGWELHRRADHVVLANMLPDLIDQARYLSGQQPGEASFRLAAEAYHLAAVLLIGVRAEDLALLAAERLQATAAQAGDQPSIARTADTWAWLFCRQSRLDDAERAALSAADTIEPRFATATPLALAMWCALLQRGITIAARKGDRGRVGDLLGLTRAASARMGANRDDAWTMSGPTNTAMHEVRAVVDMGRPRDALRVRVPALESVPPAWQARHLLDVAHAQYAIKRDIDAVATMRRIERITPGWLVYQGLAREIVRGMLRRQPGAPPGATKLATLLDME
jgi:transcriptional regulator with XRE-family HTH domain